VQRCSNAHRRGSRRQNVGGRTLRQRIRLSVKGAQAKPYPLSWAEPDHLIKALPRHLADAALFSVNTGCREQEVCQLRWDWEVTLPDTETSVFILPATVTKTSTERFVVLNTIARRVIESRRGKHKDYVFTYRGNVIGKLKSAWMRAWRLVEFVNFSGSAGRAAGGLSSMRTSPCAEAIFRIEATTTSARSYAQGLRGV
jgi:integrase